jgi:hypothetical protein
MKKLKLLRPAAVAAGLGIVYAQIVNTGLTFWACYWAVWFFGFFLVPELYWVAVNGNNTVSDNTWRFESLNRSHPFDFAIWTPVHWAFAIVFLIFAVWLFFHLVFGQLTV